MSYHFPCKKRQKKKELCQPWITKNAPKSPQSELQSDKSHTESQKISKHLSMERLRSLIGNSTPLKTNMTGRKIGKPTINESIPISYKKTLVSDLFHDFPAVAMLVFVGVYKSFKRGTDCAVERYSIASAWK